MGTIDTEENSGFFGESVSIVFASTDFFLDWMDDPALPRQARNQKLHQPRNVADDRIGMHMLVCSA